MGQHAKALHYLERAKQIQPRAPAVRSLEVILLGRAGQEAQALDLGRQAIADKVQDFDLANTTFVLAMRARDYALAEQALRLRMAGWPSSRVHGLVQLGLLYDTGLKDRERALAAFREAVALASEADRKTLLPQIPAAYRERLGLEGLAPAAPQTSANKG